MPRADASPKRGAIYTRKSSEEGLDQEFNSLSAQREALRGVHPQPATRGVGIGEKPL